MVRAVLCGFIGVFIATSSSIVFADGSSDWAALEQERIRRHLRGVELELRAVPTGHLSKEQRGAREAALGRLREYWQAGVFPHNDYLSERTPVFIDRSGRACAMGDLLIQTGADETAMVVASEENLARVTDIRSVDLGPWLEAHGLTLAEAQAIQPAYAPECPDASTFPVCGTDGVIYATPCTAADAGVEVARVCAEVPCDCARDAGTRLDAGAGTPLADDGCSAAGGGAGCLSLMLLLMLGRRSRFREAE